MQSSRLWVIGAALALVSAGCSEEPDLYLGGPPGPVTAVQVSAGRVDLSAGGTVTIGARAVDAAGNTVADVSPTVSSGSAAVASAAVGAADEQWTSTITVSGVGLGETALTVSAGGVASDVLVRVGPASVTIGRSDGGPAEVPSGGSAEYELKLWDLAGNALTTIPAEYPTPLVTSSNAARVSVERVEGEALKWVATGAQPGAANLNVASDARAARFGLPVTARASVTVVPGTFAGTLSAGSAAPGSLVTATKAAAGPAFDADSKVSLATTSAFVDGYTANTIRFAVPAIGTTAASTLTLLDMGADQIAQTTAFSATKAAADVYSPGNIDNTCSIPGTIPVFEDVMSPSRAVYIVHDGATQGRGSCLDAGSAGYDHWFTFTTGATGVTDLVATWRLAGDYDLVVCDTAAKVAANASDCEYGYSGNANDETMTDLELAPNTQYWFAFEVWSGNAGLNNVKIVLTKE